MANVQLEKATNGIQTNQQLCGLGSVCVCVHNSYSTSVQGGYVMHVKAWHKCLKYSQCLHEMLQLYWKEHGCNTRQ